MEKMTRKIYPDRQVECINSSQHEIDHKIKGVNDDNGETQEEENITRMTGKQKMKHRNVTFITGMVMRNMSTENKKDTEIKKDKNAEPESNKEEEIEKNEETVMVESQSEDEKKAEVVRKQIITRNRQLRNKERTKT